MTDNTQPEALRLAEILEGDYCPDWFYEQGVDEVAAELRRQHARIADLEAQLEAIGAGGVTGPLIGQPQAMPDLSQLTERGAVAWAGVDAQGLREGFTAADMATASAQGFRDGVASIAANAGEPTPAHIKAMERAWLWMENQADGQSKGGHETFDLMMLREERDALRAAIDVAAPPAAQAGGWMPIETAPKDSGYLLLRGGREQDVASGYWLQAAYAGNGAWIWPFVHMTPRFWAHLPPTSAEGVEHV